MYIERQCVIVARPLYAGDHIFSEQTARSKHSNPKAALTARYDSHGSDCYRKAKEAPMRSYRRALSGQYVAWSFGEGHSPDGRLKHVGPFWMTSHHQCVRSTKRHTIQLQPCVALTVSVSFASVVVANCDAMDQGHTRDEVPPPGGENSRSLVVGPELPDCIC